MKKIFNDKLTILGGVGFAIALTLTSFPAIARGISTLSGNGRIYVRTQPTIKSTAPQYGLAGDKVKVINCVQDKDQPGSDLNWCKVKFQKSKAVGWVRSDHIIFADGGE
ncbi:MAG: SH3 domain-containing protein [Snowella sp.]